MVIWLPMLWMAAGVCAFAGAHFLYVGRSRDSDWLYPAFGSLCLGVSAYIGVSALMQTPQTHASFATLERLHVGLACVIYPIAVWFLARYSGWQGARPWLITISAVFAILLVLNFTAPDGLLLASYSRQPPLTLPWGETISQFSGPPSSLAVYFYAATLVGSAIAFRCCWALRHGAQRARAVPLAIYLFVQLAAVLYAEYVTVTGKRALDWDAIPFLVLVVLLSRTLTLEMHSYAGELNRSIMALRAENAARTESQSRLQHLANHDPLTGLPNSRALRERIEAVLSNEDAAFGALLVIDVERFKIINDALGHRLGDRLVREIAQRLVQICPASAYVARLNGVEFAVLLSGVSKDRETAPARALATAELLRQGLAHPMKLDSHDLSTDVSTGLTIYPAGNADSDVLLRQAHMALHAAKAGGRRRVVGFVPPMQAEAERSLRLENDLRLALDGNLMRLQFQPQVDRHGRLVGAEALLRWTHAEFGPIAPQEFVRIAEESGQIHRLGEFALRHACAVAASLPTRTASFRMAVNISPSQLFLPNFVEGIRECVADSGIDPSHLTLEITESAFVHDVVDATLKIKALDNLGIRVAIDDFGTGYACIATLKSLPLRELKIDQIFVRDMRIDPPDRFVAAMVNMARALDIHVVAEGVESESQRDALAAMGCDAFQGYLIARPMEAADLEGWMHREQATETIA
ncbi:MAG: bifunctional diguanylate cyclase/phosphodiesterase [Rudaea sp.]